MTLRILNVAYPFAAVTPDAVGGAEQIVSQVDRAIIAAGGISIVLACAGSQVAGQLIEAPQPPELLTPEVRRPIQAFYRSAIHRAVDELDIDIVHLHGVDCLEYLPPAWVPTLITLHLPPSWYPAELFRLADSALRFSCVSRHQRGACSPATHPIQTIENGVDVESFGISPAPGNFALAVGRICPDKGFDMALEAAHAADLRLVLAGHVYPYPEHVVYFQSAILPRLDSRRRFIGPIAGRRKRRWLSLARCVVIASVVPETSSLVAMEALASGTPVVARAIGALPEIVEHGRTGFLVSSVEEMAEAMHECQYLDRRLCRQTAEQRFHASQMTQQYLKAYSEMAGVLHAL